MNLEIDMIARYVARLLGNAAEERSPDDGLRTR
jgi:riboflavin synthase alpha subunit